MKGRLIVFAKYPRPGNVKTRLVPPLSYRQAAALYTAMLCDSLSDYRKLPGIEPVPFLADPDDTGLFRRLLSEQGVIVGEKDLPVRPQRGNDLGERLANAFADLFAEGSGPTAVIGTDHPSLPPEYLSDMFEKLEDHDLVLGPADDGGYYALGLREAQPELFRDMPWSTPELFGRTVERAGRLGLRTAILPEWYDVDDRRTLRRLMEDCAAGNVGPRVAAAIAELDCPDADVPDTDVMDSTDPTDATATGNATDKVRGKERGR